MEEIRVELDLIECRSRAEIATKLIRKGIPIDQHTLKLKNGKLTTWEDPFTGITIFKWRPNEIPTNR